MQISFLLTTIPINLEIAASGTNVIVQTASSQIEQKRVAEK